MAPAHARKGSAYDRRDQPRVGGEACIASARRYLLASLGCAAFSLIYEHFSHGVWSIWMLALFAYPLLLGALPSLVCAVACVRVPHLVRQLGACAIMTLVAGSCLRGVLEIYGTTSTLISPYPLMALALMASALVAWGLSGRQRA